jgi:ABC-type multidrug transport system permease subunit
MTQKDVPLYHNVKVHHLKNSHKNIISKLFKIFSFLFLRIYNINILNFFNSYFFIILFFKSDFFFILKNTITKIDPKFSTLT